MNGGLPCCPSWSPNGQQIAWALANHPPADLYLVNTDGSGLYQITALPSATDGFPQGVIWSPTGDALIGAGSVNGPNGIWLVPLNPSPTDCECALKLISTAPGNPINFVGSIITPPGNSVVAPFGPIDVKIGQSGVPLTWPTNSIGGVLETTDNLGTPDGWTPIVGPIQVVGTSFFYSEPAITSLAAKFLGLHYKSP